MTMWGSILIHFSVELVKIIFKKAIKTSGNFSKGKQQIENKSVQENIWKFCKNLWYLNQGQDCTLPTPSKVSESETIF